MDSLQGSRRQSLALGGLLVLGLTSRVSAHGWMTHPMSKNQMARIASPFPTGMPTSFRYEPQTAAYGNGFGQVSFDGGSSCGAREADYAKGLDLWQRWYDASGVPVPRLIPGSDFEVTARLTADHGGVAWFMVACGSEINEQVPWTYLERAASDRGHHFMPSNPGIYAWRRGDNSGTITAVYTVPADLSCPDGKAVGRWLWKTGNSCIDANNKGRSTETFVLSEYSAVAGGSQLSVCGGPPEVFISCVDFLVTDSPSGPSPAVPTPPTPGPSPTPVSPTPVPSTQSPGESSPPGDCKRQDDCSISPWCNNAVYITWCPQQGEYGSCPAPFCTQVTSPQPEAEPEQEPEPEQEAEPEGEAEGEQERGPLGCTRQNDCDLSDKCSDDEYMSWCPQQGRQGSCPAPHCTFNLSPSPEPCANVEKPGHNCETYEALGTSYCMHPDIAPLCCYCGGGTRFSADPEAEPEAEPEHEAEPEQEGEPEVESEPEQVCTMESDCGAGWKCCCSEDVALASHDVAETGKHNQTGQIDSGLNMLQFGSLSHRGLARGSKTSASLSCKCIPDDEPCAQPAPLPPAPERTCVPHSVLVCINEASSFWPKCDPSQTKTTVGPTGYFYGHYCAQEWADALNDMLKDPAVDICEDDTAIHNLLAQIAYETAYFSTVYQPRDGGAGLIHMIPANWVRNAVDMDELWPGNDYTGKAMSMQETFFQSPEYGWRSVAAWYKITNEVIPGCGIDLLNQPYETQTKCILSRVVDRSESFNIVGTCLAQAAM